MTRSVPPAPPGPQQLPPEKMPPSPAGRALPSWAAGLPSPGIQPAASKGHTHTHTHTHRVKSWGGGVSAPWYESTVHHPPPLNLPLGYRGENKHLCGEIHLTSISASRDWASHGPMSPR